MTGLVMTTSTTLIRKLEKWAEDVERVHGYPTSTIEARAHQGPPSTANRHRVPRFALPGDSLLVDRAVHLLGVRCPEYREVIRVRYQGQEGTSRNLTPEEQVQYWAESGHGTRRAYYACLAEAHLWIDGALNGLAFE